VCAYQLNDTVNEYRRAFAGTFYHGVIVETPNAVNKQRYLVALEDGPLLYTNANKLHVAFSDSENDPQTDEFERGADSLHRGNSETVFACPRLNQLVRDFLAFSFHADRQTALKTALTHTFKRQNSKCVEVLFETKWQDAVVDRFDNYLMFLKYTSGPGKSEWLHCASPRLRVNYEAVHGRVTTVDLRASLSCGDAIRKHDSRLDGHAHTCSAHCVRYENADMIEYTVKEAGLLCAPLCCGWTRQTAARTRYVTPCGRVLCTIDQVDEFLYTTRSLLTIDMFTFTSQVEPLRKFEMKAVIYFIAGI
jgi:hypothetical protein